MYSGEKTFRCATWLKCFIIGCTILATTLALFEYSGKGITWISIGLSVLSVASIVAIGAVFTDGIDLENDGLIMRKNFRQTEIKRSDIEAAKWEKGSGVSLCLSGDRWVKVPEVGRNAQNLCNSLRAWIKAD